MKKLFVAIRIESNRTREGRIRFDSIQFPGKLIQLNIKGHESSELNKIH